MSEPEEKKASEEDAKKKDAQDEYNYMVGTSEGPSENHA